MELNNRIRALNKYAENEHATALAQLRFVDTFVLPHAADTTIRRRRDVRQSPAIFYRANDDYTTTTTAAHTKRHRVKRGGLLALYVAFNRATPICYTNWVSTNVTR